MSSRAAGAKRRTVQGSPASCESCAWDGQQFVAASAGILDGLIVTRISRDGQPLAPLPTTIRKSGILDVVLAPPAPGGPGVLLLQCARGMYSDFVLRNGGTLYGTSMGEVVSVGPASPRAARAVWLGDHYLLHWTESTELSATAWIGRVAPDGTFLDGNGVLLHRDDPPYQSDPPAYAMDTDETNAVLARAGAGGAITMYFVDAALHVTERVLAASGGSGPDVGGTARSTSSSGARATCSSASASPRTATRSIRSRCASRTSRPSAPFRSTGTAASI